MRVKRKVTTFCNNSLSDLFHILLSISLEDLRLVEYLVFTRMSGESYRRRFRPLLFVRPDSLGVNSRHLVRFSDVSISELYIHFVYVVCSVSIWDCCCCCV